MEEALAGFAADGKAPGDIGARSETALHGIANGHVFVLHFFALVSSIFQVRAGTSSKSVRSFAETPRPACSKNVVVLCSKRLKSGMNESTAPRCNCLRNIVESKIFRTNQESR